MILLHKLLTHYEASNWKNWKRFPELPTGGKSMEIDDELNLKGFRQEILEDIRLLEREGLIFLRNDDWRERNYDAARIRYRMEDIEGVYRLARREPIWVRWERQKEDLAGWRKGITTPWISRGLDEWEERLARGAVFAASDWAHRERVCRCLQGLDELERFSQEDSPRVPMYLRVFSKYYLGNSKEFHRQYEKTIIGMARRLHPEADADSEAMDDGAVLRLLHIDNYSQELTIKGSLRIELAGKCLDTADYPYGLVLNEPTLRSARLCEKQTIRRILTIENKANFMAEPLEEGKLVVFTHGYLSPRERAFLSNLAGILRRQGDPVRYEHSGDLDYGGICIYRHLREKVFPELRPCRMDLETYEGCLARELTEEISESMAEKLAALSTDPQLGELAARLAVDRRVAEQEALL